MLVIMVTLGLFFVPNSSHADLISLPEIKGGNPSPIVDGNITAVEWQDSVTLNTTINGHNASVRVVKDDTTLYIGFNYTTPDFVFVNDTIPINSTVAYNNATHDWLVLQIDNNLDQQELGTESSPDDAIVIDQYNSSYFDGYFNGNLTHPVFSDLNNSGTEDSSAIRANYSVTEGIQVVYEFTKTLESIDTNGSDFRLSKARILQFRFISWLNKTANATLVESEEPTEWLTLRLNETGSGIATKEAAKTNIRLSLEKVPENEFLGLPTVLSQYGFGSLSDRAGNFSFEDQDLVVLILGSESTITALELDKLSYYAKLGGQVLVFLSDEDTTSSETIANEFGLTFLPNSVILPGVNNNPTQKTIRMPGSAINRSLPFSVGPTLVTDQEVNDLEFSSSALNISNLLDKSTTPYILSQDYHVYDIFNLPDNMVYDANGNGNIDDDENANFISLGVSIDLLKGGRISIIPSSATVSDEYLTESDNIPFLLRLIPWNSRIVNTISINSTSVDQHAVTRGHTINLNLNLEDGLGNVIMDEPELSIRVDIIRTGNTVTSYTLSGTGPVYTQELDISYHGWMDIKTTAFLIGYGFAEGEKIAIFSQNTEGSYNDLTEISFLLIIVFIITIVIVAIIWVRTK